MQISTFISANESKVASIQSIASISKFFSGATSRLKHIYVCVCVCFSLEVFPINGKHFRGLWNAVSIDWIDVTIDSYICIYIHAENLFFSDCLLHVRMLHYTLYQTNLSLANINKNLICMFGFDYMTKKE